MIEFNDYQEKLLNEVIEKSSSIFYPLGTCTTHSANQPLTMEKLQEARRLIGDIPINSVLRSAQPAPRNTPSQHNQLTQYGHIGALSFNGILIYENCNMVEQWRRPRSKSKRIQKKWSKTPFNWRPSRDLILNKMTGTACCHPVLYQEIKQQIREKL